MTKKQKPLLKSGKFLSRRTFSIQNYRYIIIEHALYMKEINSYKEAINKILTTIILPDIILLSYVISILFSKHLDRLFFILYCFVFIGHFSVIILIFYLCSQICNFNRNFSRNLKLFLYSEQYKNHLTIKHKWQKFTDFKKFHTIDMIIQSSEGYSLAFELKTGNKMNANTCLMVKIIIYK